MAEIDRKDENFYIKLANILYDLDTKVYVATKSNLGRHFQGSKEKNIDDLVQMMTADYQVYRLRSEIASIGNMIRTIQDKETRESLMNEYDVIVRELHKHENSFDSVEIINQKVAGLNASNFRRRKRGKNEHLVICISRSHSSAGSDIGFALAEALHINYYDTDVLKGILDAMDKERDIDWMVEKAANDPKYARAVKMAERINERGMANARNFSRYHGLPKEDADFFNISKILVETAKNEDYVVIGRCADVILANNNIPHLSIFITAPIDIRARHLMKTDGIESFTKAVKAVLKEDRKHKRYYKKYTGKRWGQYGNYDLALNSSSYGIDESVEVIKRIVQSQ